MQIYHRTIATVLLAWVVGHLWAQTDTTAFMRKLCSVNGVSAVSALPTNTFQEKYVLKMSQQVDWQDSSKGSFGQRVIVGLKGTDRPTVLVTEGYSASYGLSEDYEEELCKLLNANVVLCEYRYFAESVPQPTNWDYMTVAGSIGDYHHIRQALDSLFPCKWVSTGISKGGQTAMFYRAAYPDDVDAGVSYVAPLNRALQDGRHERFLAKEVGTKPQRKQVKQAMRELMRRKPVLLPRFREYCDRREYRFALPTEDVYDYCVLEYPFAFWQWGTSTETIPSADAGDSIWLGHLLDISSPDYFSQPNQYVPFFVQAVRELGYYGYSLRPIRKWASLRSTDDYVRRLMLPDSLAHYSFSPELYKQTVHFLRNNDPTHIFIYGGDDPWTASGVAGWLDCSRKRNMRVYVQPHGSHRARIGTLPSDMKDDVLRRLKEWLSLL